MVSDTIAQIGRPRVTEDTNKRFGARSPLLGPDGVDAAAIIRSAEVHTETRFLCCTMLKTRAISSPTVRSTDCAMNQ